LWMRRFRVVIDHEESVVAPGNRRPWLSRSEIRIADRPGKPAIFLRGRDPDRCSVRRGIRRFFMRACE
jgi:hypothetical protein